ncbi:hypothetical protein LGMK_06060 [Leuconostoc sp. C2]|nr:hypothetical protein LGMK_06060 [Leuconostoc sp. C2]
MTVVSSIHINMPKTKIVSFNLLLFIINHLFVINNVNINIINNFVKAIFNDG